MAENKRALVIVDQVPLKDRDVALTTRLKEKLGFKVESFESRNIPAGELETSDLIIVCSSHAPSILRNSAVPIIVCNAEALYDLGMTFGKPNEDYGNARYETVNVDDALVAHPITAGLIGPQTVTVGLQGSGWAKPGAEAVVAATIGRNRDKAVIFAYDSAAHMPGIKAAHRRAAFLLAGDQSHSLNQRGWDLFDAAADWAIHGANVTPSQRHAESSPNDSVRLTGDKYLDWRDDRVGERVYLRLGKKMSILGIGGIISVVGIIFSLFKNIETDLSTKVNTDVPIKTQEILNEKLPGLVQAVKDEANERYEKLSERLPKEIAWTIIEVGKLDERLKEKTEAMVSDELKKEGLSKVIYKRLSSLVEGSHISISRRKKALELMTYFAIDEKKLLEYLLKIISDSKEDQMVLKVALDSFQPESTGVDCKDLGQIKTGLYDEKRSVLYTEYTNFLSKFSGDCTLELFKWVRENPSEDASEIVIDALSKFNGNEGSNSAVVENLYELLVDDVDGKKRIKPLGLRGLKVLDLNLEIGADVRRKAINSVIENIEKYGGDKSERSFEFHSYVDNLYMAIQNFSYQKIQELKLDAPRFANTKLNEFYQSIEDEWISLKQISEEFHNTDQLLRYLTDDEYMLWNEALFKLLRPDDWVFVLDKVRKSGPKKNELQSTSSREQSKTDNHTLDTLMYNWIKRLEGSRETQDISTNAKEMEGMYTELMKIPDALYSKGYAKAIAYIITKGKPELSERFLEGFLENYMREHRNSEFLGQDALKIAIEMDGKSKNAFSATKKMLGNVTETGNDDKIDKHQVLYALIVDSFPKKIDDKEVRELLFGVVNKKGNFSRSKAVFAAVSSLGYGAYDMQQEEDALKEATEVLLGKLKTLTDMPQSPESKSNLGERGKRDNFEDIDDESTKLHKEIMNALDQFCISAREKCKKQVLDRIVDKLPSMKQENLKHVRAGLVNFSVERYLFLSYVESYGSFDEEIESMTQVLELDPSRTEAYSRRGIAYRNTEQYKKAIEDFKYIENTTIKEGYPGNNGNLAFGYIMTNDETSAVKYVNLAVEEYPDKKDKARVQENLGILFLRNSEWKEALHNTEKVRKLYDEEELAWNSLIHVIALNKLGEKKKEDEAFMTWINVGDEKDISWLKQYIPANLIGQYEERSLAAWK